MRVLLLCNKLPYPPKEGAPMAMSMIIEGLLNQGHQVKVLAVNSNKYHINLDEIPSEYKKKTLIETIDLNLSPNFIDAFYCFISGKSYHIQRFISEKFNRKLVEILKNQEFDIVQFETLSLTSSLPLIRKYSQAKVLLRSHNIEHQIWSRLANLTSNPIKRFYFNHLSKTLRKYEISILPHFDGIICISSVDAEFYKKHSSGELPIIVATYGVNFNKYTINTTAKEQVSLCFIGAMNWLPNIHGIRWFLSTVWPIIEREFPALKFVIASKIKPNWLTEIKSSQVKFIGDVKSSIDFISSNTIMVVPLFAGSGIRIKIIEAMALRKAVISTSIGAEGINYEDQKNIAIADTSDAFIKAIRKCVRENDFRNKLGMEAALLAGNNHDAQKITKELNNFYGHFILN